MSTILVTGANGYIGRHVVKELCDLGHAVIACDFNFQNVDKRAKCFSKSIFDDSFSVDLLPLKPDICLHLAWRNGFDHNNTSHITDLPKHLSFLKKLIDANIKNIAVMGTMHEIGYYEGCIDEFTPCNPLSLYGIAKNSLRQSLFTLANNKKINLYWLRGFYITGDDANNHSIFSKILEAVKNNAVSFPLNSGKNKYDFIDINTMARQISLAITQKDIVGIINICSGEPVSLKDKINKYIEINHLNIKLDYGKFPDRLYDSPAIWGNNTKITSIIKNYESKQK